MLLPCGTAGIPAQVLASSRPVVFPLSVAAFFSMFWQMTRVNKTWLALGDFIVWLGGITDVPRVTGQNRDRAKRYAGDSKEEKGHNGWGSPEGFVELAGGGWVSGRGTSGWWGGEAARWARHGRMRSRATQRCRAGLGVATGKPHLHAIANCSISNTF